MSHDELDDVFRQIAEARRAADALVLGWQRQVRPGDRCLSYNHEVELFVFHEILDPLAGAVDEEERTYLRETYAEPHMEHYRFTKSYSAMCPEGELGDIHVSIVSLVIPLSVWDRCRAWDWYGNERIIALLAQQIRLVNQLTFERLAPAN